MPIFANELVVNFEKLKLYYKKNYLVYTQADY